MQEDGNAMNDIKATFREKWTDAKMAWYSERPSYIGLIECGDAMLDEIERLRAEVKKMSPAYHTALCERFDNE